MGQKIKKSDYAWLLPVFTWILLYPLFTPGEQIITDQLGRRVAVPERPERIISLAPNITEIVFAINQGHRLVGATTFSDYPEAARRLPKVGSYVRPDVEKIVALRPDLCIATKDGNPIEIIAVLEALKIPIYAVDPRSLDTVMRTVDEIGRLLDAPDAANRVLQDMKQRIQRVEDKIGKAGTRPRVFYQIGISPIVSAGTDTCINELIERAGGENSAKGPAAYPRLSHEQVLGLSPDIILITSMSKGVVFEEVKKQWSRWKTIPAVQNDRVYLMDSDLLDRPTPRLVAGLEKLALIIHPELFKENH